MHLAPGSPIQCWPFNVDSWNWKNKEFYI